MIDIPPQAITWGLQLLMTAFVGEGVHRLGKVQATLGAISTEQVRVQQELVDHTRQDKQNFDDLKTDIRELRGAA